MVTGHVGVYMSLKETGESAINIFGILDSLPLHHNMMLLVPDYPKSSSQLHICYKGATSWNNLPVEMLLIQTYTQFKNMQKINAKSSMK